MTEEIIRRLGGELGYKIVVFGPERGLVRVDGLARRRRRWRAECRIQVGLHEWWGATDLANDAYRGCFNTNGANGHEAAVKRIEKMLSRLSFGRAAAVSWDTTSSEGGMCLECRFVLADVETRDLVVAFAESVAPFLTDEAARAEREVMERIEEARTISNASDYVSWILSTANERGLAASDYEARLSALRDERDRAIVAAAEQIVSGAELRAALAAEGGTVDERALRAAHALAGAKLAQRNERGASRPLLVPEFAPIKLSRQEVFGD